MKLTNDKYQLKLPVWIFDELNEYKHSLYCPTCTSCKAKEKRIRKRTADPPRVAESPMDCWYADLTGPFSEYYDNELVVLADYNGYKYILTVVDEYSRFVMVTPLKKKSDATQSLIYLIKLQENLTGKTLKRIHTDNGTEFCNEVFESFLTTKDKVTEHTTTIPDTSVHNSIVERMHQTLQTISRCLILHCNGPQEICADAMIQSAFIVNSTAQPVINGDVPAERMYNGVKMGYNLDKIFIFGCNVEVVINEKERGKFQPRTEPGIYLGIDRQHNEHKILLIRSHKIVIRRSVIFNEDNFSYLLAESLRLSKMAQDALSSMSKEEKEYDVKYIRDDRINSGIKEYLVQWKKSKYPTWEPESILTEDCPDIIKEYKEIKKMCYATAISTMEHADEAGVYVTVADYIEPKTFTDVLVHPDKDKWLESMHEEIHSLEKREVLKLSYPPEGKEAIDCKWVFKAKRNEKNEISRYKTRLVAKGFSQIEGEDYWETFSPTVSIKSIKWLLALAAQHDLEIKQIDFDTAFLNADLKEEIYMKIPSGYYHKDYKPGMVFRLNKALYGLKQAPREWWKTLDKLLLTLGYRSSPLDECLYLKIVDGKRIYLAVYVDDTIAVYPSSLEKIWLEDKDKIAQQYAIKDVGNCQWILNMAVTRDRKNGTITLSQHGYMELLLHKYQQDLSGRIVSTPFLYRDLSVPPTGIDVVKLNDREQLEYRSIVGSLLYAANITRIDLSYIIGILTRHVNEPFNYHMSAARRVLQYVRERTDKKLIFSFSNEQVNNYKIIIYSDSNHAGDKCDRKSTSGWISTFNDHPICWQSKKQSTTALSSTEAELYGLCEAVKESLFLRQWFQYYTGKIPEIEIRGDNQGSLFQADHTTNHNRTKHVDVQYFFIREHIHNGDIYLKYVSTMDELADILTKATRSEIFGRLCQRLLI